MAYVKRTINNIVIECIKGDIASQNDITAIVNAANAELRRGGGVAGAIHRVAGPGLEKEAVPKGPIKPGEVIITGGHNLPNKYVIHCLGPVYGVDKPENVHLSNCYKNAIKLADKNKIDSIAFPAISTGIFGYPMKEAAETAFRAIFDVLKDLTCVKLIRFVLYSNKDLEIHEKALDSINSSKIFPKA